MKENVEIRLLKERIEMIIPVSSTVITLSRKSNQRSASLPASFPVWMRDPIQANNTTGRAPISKAVKAFIGRFSKFEARKRSSNGSSPESRV
jgi:hypothetical protein